jgi:hypothetical protein
MWGRGRSWNVRRRPRTAVEIAGHHRCAAGEGVIERMRDRGGHVDVTLLLADGRPAATRLDRLEADWLELRIGDIVPVRPLAERSVSA